MTENEIVKQAVVHILHLDIRELQDDSTFYHELGADDLDLLAILTQIGEELSIRFSEAEAASVRTVGDLVRLTESKAKRPDKQ